MTSPILATTLLALLAAPAADNGEAVIQRAVDAYRAVPGLHDTMKLTVAVEGYPPEKHEFAYGFGDGTDAYVRLPGLAAHVVNGTFTLARDEAPTKFFEMPVTENIVMTVEQLFGGQANLPAPLAFRQGGELSDHLSALTLGGLEQPALAGTERIDDGRGTLDQVTLTGANGEGLAFFDAKTGLLSSVIVETTQQISRATRGRVKAEMHFTPRPQTSGKGIATFDPGARTRVNAVADLAPDPLRAGDPAPEFSLLALDGSTVSLAELRGQVVVLDFWATWCGPCRRGLPLLSKFTEWANESGKPVAVFGVDVFERGERAAIEAKVNEYWKKQGFVMPTLLDHEGAVGTAYQVQSIPFTVVIDPHGRVAAIHVGFDPGMGETLKRDVERALAATEGG